MASVAQEMKPQQINNIQRSLLLQNAVPMKQSIFKKTYADPSTEKTVRITPRNVGLITKFLVIVDATCNCTDVADDAAISDMGVANLLSQVSFTDLNNNTRINTTGAHLHFVSTVKKRNSNASAHTLAVGATASGDVFSVIKKPATIAKTTSDAVRMVYEVPLAYSAEDLRGAIYANVVNATMSLDLTVNTDAFADKDVDSTKAVYKGAAGTLSDVTIEVYQYYYDQIPMGDKGAVLPMLDLSTVYELKNTQFNNIASATDFPVPYANFRDFLSTFAVYNNDPSKDAGRVGGTDVNSFALTSANFTNIFKVSPIVAAMETRDLIGTDLPKGVYYFDHRRKPISTTMYGNMELVLNASAAAAGAYLAIGWEDFALVNTLTQAGSLAG